MNDSDAERPDADLHAVLRAMAADPPAVDWPQVVGRGIARRRRNERLIKVAAVLAVILISAALTSAVRNREVSVYVGPDPDTTAVTTVTSSPPAPTRPSPPAVPAGRPQMYLGASVTLNPGETPIDALHRTESLTENKMTLDHQYYRWDAPFPIEVQDTDKAEGRIPLLNWAPRLVNGDMVAWKSIADGASDALITTRAQSLRALEVPAILSFNAAPYDEFKKGWGSEADFAAAFRHIVDVFRANDADNVKFAWLMADYDFTMQRADPFYPGDDVVDWIGAGSYNFYQRTHTWDTLPTMLGPFFTWAAAKDKPLMIPEIGCEEDPADPNHKAQWLDEARTYLSAQPRLRAVVYFDEVSPSSGDQLTYDWRIDTSPRALAAWRRFAADPKFAT
jgi:hypothetical protein